MPAPGQGSAWPTDRRGTRKTRGHLENISSSAKSAGVVPGRGAKTPQRRPSPPLPRRVRDLVRESWAQIGLDKGEAHHALKNALRIGRHGEIRDRTAEGQHCRMAGLDLLATIIIYWNTAHLGQAAAQRKRAGLDCSPELLTHISPLGWAHILLTGEYRWPNR